MQNRYSVTDRAAEQVLKVCESLGIGFIPWFPLAAGKISAAGNALEAAAARARSTSSQLALAWLLWRSPVMLPIPGTSRADHLEENIAAANIKIDEGILHTLTQLAQTA